SVAVKGRFLKTSSNKRLHSKSAQADVALGSDAGYVRLYGDYRDVGNYQDGDGQTVSSAFRSLNGGVLLTGDVFEFTRMEANLELTRDRNILYAGSGMDAPLADASIWRFKVQHEAPVGILDEQAVNLYFSEVTHQMDNYTVRLRKPGNPNGMRTPSDSKVVGGRWLGTVFLERAEWHIGFDARSSQQNAERFQVNRTSQAQSLKSVVWPGVEQRQWGLFSELDYRFSAVDRVWVGGRYDDLDAKATKAHVSTLGNDSPDALYKKYYGTDARSARDHNVSALISWQHGLGDASSGYRQYLEFRGSRSVRSTDATERFIAARGSCCHGSDDWVGNPLIKPEQHYQLDAGYHFQKGRAQLSTVVYLDEVSDYIIRYYSASGALLYRNTGARIYGADLEVEYPLGRFKPSGSLSWTRGVNRDPSGPHDENLPQIPALLARFALEYESGSWRLGGRCELAASQDKVNLASGQDQGESPGFDVWHLYGAWQMTPEVRLQGGVDNLFDRTYAWHVSRGNVDPLSPGAVRVNEPGRLLWLGVGVVF
ncbi:MAG: TonB-dependent receptor domain-containing protein, partial [Endozoicomonas sp.]